MRQSGIILLNFGGPRSLEEVPAFLFEILRDPNTIQLPFPQALQDRLAARIARRRSVEVGRQYAEIGGSSPIVPATARLRDALQAALAAALGDAADGVPLFIAHRYLPGDTRAAVQAVMAAGVQRLFAVPLYPHFSFATTGSSLEQLRQELDHAGWEGELRAWRSHPDTPGFLEAHAARLQAVLEAEIPPKDSTVILCSAHGLPLSYVEQGDPYRLELYRTVEALRARFPDWRFDLSFQSRVGPAEWLRPYTDEYLGDLASGGTTHVVFLPLAFVNDHIETLYEIGYTYFEQARGLGMTPLRVPAIEDHPGYVRDLRDAVLAWHAGRAGTPVAELLPPDQRPARVGRWAWLAWWAALTAALAAALG